MVPARLDPGQNFEKVVFLKIFFDFQSQNLFEYIRYILVRDLSLANCKQTCKISSKLMQDSKSYRDNGESSSAKIAFWENRV